MCFVLIPTTVCTEGSDQLYNLGQNTGLLAKKEIQPRSDLGGMVCHNSFCGLTGWCWVFQWLNVGIRLRKPSLRKPQHSKSHLGEASNPCHHLSIFSLKGTENNSSTNRNIPSGCNPCPLLSTCILWASCNDVWFVLHSVGTLIFTNSKSQWDSFWDIPGALREILHQTYHQKLRNLYNRFDCNKIKLSAIQLPDSVAFYPMSQPLFFAKRKKDAPIAFLTFSMLCCQKHLIPAV